MNILTCYLPAVDKKMESNSFLVPRWGGFYIYNVNSTADSYPVRHDVDMGQVLTELIPQLKTLMGFNSDFSVSNIILELCNNQNAESEMRFNSNNNNVLVCF